MLKKLILVILSFVILFLCGCKQDLEQVEFQDEYNHYMNTVSIGSNIFESGESYTVWRVGKGIKKNPDVLVSIYTSEQGFYEWLTKPSNKQKNDLKAVGDNYISFSKSQNWSNDYHLYIEYSMQGSRGYSAEHFQIIYDYETDTLFVPVHCDVYLQMYEQFDTFWHKDLESTSQGKEFLVEHGFGEIKHGEYEQSYEKFDNSMIYIYSGEGKDRGKLNGVNELYNSKCYTII